MTVTSIYHLVTDVSPETIAAIGLNNVSVQSSVTGLANGGYAFLAQDALGYSDLFIYDGTGQLVGSNTDCDLTDAKLVQLTNGNILMVGDTGTKVDYRIFDQTGLVVGAGTSSRNPIEENAGVTAMANGGFAIVSQEAFTGTDHDISIDIHATGGATTFSLALDQTDADDENASIAQLADGGFAIAWERIDSSGHSTLWSEILNQDGSVRLPENLVALDEAITRQPSVTALANGGFSITYEDNGWNGQSEIAEMLCDRYGNETTNGPIQITGASTPYSQPASATLSNGIVVTASTAFSGSADTDIAFSAYDTSIGELLGYGTALDGANTTDKENTASIAALSDNRFAVTFSDQTTDVNKVGIYEFQRTTTGDAGNNTLIGDGIADIIYGFAGNDVITPGDAASNTVSGGVGYDTVNFSGPRAAYVITRKGLLTTVARADGTDTLASVEKLHFADQDVFTPAQVRDLNGDGISDMLLQSTGGAIRFWQIGSDGSLVANTVTSTTPAAAWHVVGTGNFNFAAVNNMDILLQNTNGALDIWEMSGATVAANVSLGSLNPVWKAVTTGDFNGDGNADILLQNTTTGQIDIWTMNGATVTDKAVAGSTPGVAWHAIATGDFNGDGKSDILFQNDNGQAMVRLMSGSTVLSTTNVGTNPGTAWHVRGAGDVNGDGRSDIIWQNTTTGQVMVWEMNGATVTSSAIVGTVATSWTLTGTGDFNGDGDADLVFQNSNSAVSEWLMNGTTILTKQGVGSSPGTAWHLVAGTGG